MFWLLTCTMPLPDKSARTRSKHPPGTWIFFNRLPMRMTDAELELPRLTVRRRRLLFSFSPPARFPWHLFLGLPGLPAFAAAMVERGQQDGDGIQPAVPFRFRRGTPEAFNEAIDDSEVRKRQVPSLAQRPKFPAAPRNDYIAALERAPKIPDAQTQHGANDGGDGAAIGLVPRLVLEPQVGSDSPKERLFSAAAVAKPSLADQADTEQRS